MPLRFVCILLLQRFFFIGSRLVLVLNLFRSEKKRIGFFFFYWDNESTNKSCRSPLLETKLSAGELRSAFMDSVNKYRNRKLFITRKQLL